MQKQQSLYAFIISPKGEIADHQIHLVMAENQGTAMDNLIKSRTEKKYAYKCCGFFTKDDLFPPATIDPMNTSAALRYATKQYGKVLTKTQVKHLRDSALAIERSFIGNINE